LGGTLEQFCEEGIALSHLLEPFSEVDEVAAICFAFAFAICDHCLAFLLRLLIKPIHQCPTSKHLNGPIGTLTARQPPELNALLINLNI
jgi:hypothetical protein